MARETFEYGKLIAGETQYIIKVPCAKGTYKVGDVLEFTVTSSVASGDTPTFSQTVATNYKKATAEASIGNAYVVCYEDVTVGADGDEVVCIKEGYFNENVIKINDAAITDKSKVVLLTKNIFVTKVQKA